MTQPPRTIIEPPSRRFVTKMSSDCEIFELIEAPVEGTPPSPGAELQYPISGTAASLTPPLPRTRLKQIVAMAVFIRNAR